MKIYQRVSVIGLALLLVLSLFCAMVVQVDAAQDRPLKIWKENDNGKYSTFNVVDENTGVNYVVVAVESSRGHGVSVCPRYNADGSLYVS